MTKLIFGECVSVFLNSLWTLRVVRGFTFLFPIPLLRGWN